MITAWTKNCTSDDEVQRFKNQFQGAKGVLIRLKELLEEEKAALEMAEISPKIYDSPGWDYKQAHTNGFKAALRMVNTLINPDQGVNNGGQPN